MGADGWFKFKTFRSFKTTYSKFVCNLMFDICYNCSIFFYKLQVFCLNLWYNILDELPKTSYGVYLTLINLLYKT